MTQKEIREYFAKFGKKGGHATARKLTPEQRKESARKAAQARWAKGSLRALADATRRKVMSGTRAQHPAQDS